MCRATKSTSLYLHEQAKTLSPKRSRATINPHSLTIFGVNRFINQSVFLTLVPRDLAHQASDMGFGMAFRSGNYTSIVQETWLKWVLLNYG